jgi:energy-coupling factor transporter ATP-binding protein EcfA2
LVREKAYSKYKFRGSPYFYLLDTGNFISQFNLSTGENLLVSVLNSINFQVRNKPVRDQIYLVLLDEVELALHPSALNRMVDFLKRISDERNIAVYFSTHSVELIRKISADNIYYLKRHLDNTVEVQNPVSPAYATRAIYIHDGYDILILVEDILAKNIVQWIINKEKLAKQKLLHIITAGGWENVLNLHDDIISSNIIKGGQKVISVLDGDVENYYRNKYVNNGVYGNLNVYFLPLNSAEKYLREKLVDNVDYDFYNDFNDYFFKRKSLDELLQEYSEINGTTQDKKGKKLISILKKEIIALRQSEKEFYTFLTEYIVESEKEKMQTLAERIKRIFR